MNDNSNDNVGEGYRSQFIRSDGIELLVTDISNPKDAATLGKIPDDIKVSPLFVAARNDCRCPNCDFTYEDWQSPDATAERTFYFNQYQTAIINTGAEAVARVQNNELYRNNKAAATVEIVRLFLLTDPVQLAMLMHYRPARTETGDVKSSEWATIIEPAVTPAPSVETGNPIDAASAELQSGDSMLGDLGDGNDLRMDI